MLRSVLHSLEESLEEGTFLHGQVEETGVQGVLLLHKLGLRQLQHKSRNILTTLDHVHTVDNTMDYSPWFLAKIHAGKSINGKGRHTHLRVHSVLTLFLHNRPADLHEIWRGYNT